MALTEEQERYYQDMEEMFSTKGWKTLIEDAKATIYQYQADGLEAPNWDSVNVLRGKALQLAELTNLEETTLLQKGILEQEDDDADV